MASDRRTGTGRYRGALGIFALATLLLALTAPAADARDAYVANEGSGTVSVIDLISGDLVGNPIEVGDGSGTVAITPDGKRAYVANHLSESVSVIDTASNETVGDPIEVGEGPRGVAISPDGTRAYVANEESGTISVIDTASDAVVDEIEDVAGARGIAVTPDGRRLYVGQDESNTVVVIDTESGEPVGDPIEVGSTPHSDPQGIAFTPDGTRAYVANLFSENVAVIDTGTGSVVDTITVGFNPVGVAISPDGRRAYVANEGSDSVSVIDIASDETVGDPIEVGDGPRGVAVSPSGTRAYVTTGFFTGNPGTLAAIDTAGNATVGTPTPLESDPLGIAIVPDQPPLASLSSAAGTAGQPVHFDASASSDPDGQIARYDWNFGDGHTALDAGPTPSHTYSASGNYRATVTLTDSEGCSTSFVFTGITASCNGSSVASAARTVQVASPPPPPNEFHIGKLQRDKRTGIVKLKVSVPGSGTLQLRGNQVRARTSTVDGPRTVTLVVQAKPKATKALKRRGHLKVQVKITFRPNGGEPLTKTLKLTLVKKPGR